MNRCPECESDLELDGYDLDVGETINCPECDSEISAPDNAAGNLKVVSTKHDVAVLRNHVGAFDEGTIL